MRRRRRAAAPSPSLSAEAYRGRGGALEIWRYIGDMARGALCECHMPIESILCWGGGGWCASEIGDAPQASTGLSTGVMRGGALVESDHEPRAAGQPLGILLRAGAAYGKPQWHSPQRESSLQRAAPNSKLPLMRNAGGGRDRAREAERDSVLIDAAARERVSTAPHTKGPTVMWHPLFEKNARSRFDMCEFFFGEDVKRNTFPRLLQSYQVPLGAAQTESLPLCLGWCRSRSSRLVRGS